TVTAATAGPFHTCALLVGGAVRCWGDDQQNQATVPNDLGTVTAVSAGAEHTCALVTGGYRKVRLDHIKLQNKEGVVSSVKQLDSHVTQPCLAPCLPAGHRPNKTTGASRTHTRLSLSEGMQQICKSCTTPLLLTECPC
ncbi:MAG: hypothetical protein J3K34DRAFT_372885, partial [Monoraphidium minutum]